jgi:hypothetical protein
MKLLNVWWWYWFRFDSELFLHIIKKCICSDALQFWMTTQIVVSVKEFSTSSSHGKKFNNSSDRNCFNCFILERVGERWIVRYWSWFINHQKRSHKAGGFTKWSEINCIESSNSTWRKLIGSDNPLSQEIQNHQSVHFGLVSFCLCKIYSVHHHSLFQRSDPLLRPHRFPDWTALSILFSHCLNIFSFDLFQITTVQIALTIHLPITSSG